MLRTSGSSIELRLSSEDFLLPVARSSSRNSISSLQDLTLPIFALTPTSTQRKQDIQSQIDKDFPEYQYTAKLDSSDDEIKALVSYFFPDDDTSMITIKKLTGGITNVLYLIKGLSVPKILLRISGENTEEIIDREQELVTLVCLASIKVAPQLYGRFKNGLFYGFVEGVTTTPEQLKDPIISQLIAEHLGYFHAKAEVVGIPQVPILFDTIEKWLIAAQTQRIPEIKQALDDIGFSLEKSKPIVDRLRTELENSPLAVRYCHNDLLSGNIIYDEENEGGATVHFIDFEYGGYNYRGFDIANHFCEMMGFDLDKNAYPSDSFQTTWIETYVKSYMIHSDDEIPKDFASCVNELKAIVDRFSVLAHLFWGIWALIQHQYSTNKSFDYLSYAKLRLSAFLFAIKQK